MDLRFDVLVEFPAWFVHDLVPVEDGDEFLDAQLASQWLT